MAIFKRMLILANSIKLGGRCLAGREIQLNGECEYRIGPWLRPVSHVDGREIKHIERFYWPQDPVKVGDFVEVALAEKMNEPWHPENWRLASLDPWRRIADAFVFPPLDLLEEHPPGLWLEPGQRTDRIAHEELLANPPTHSLVMIRPEDFRLELSSMMVEDELKRRRRCLFRYRGVDYDMGMTDPVIGNRYAARIPGPDDPIATVRLPGGDPRLLCVSLACDFQGFHYKVVATIFER
jgi:hypothetical protein